MRRKSIKSGVARSGVRMPCEATEGSPLGPAIGSFTGRIGVVPSSALVGQPVVNRIYISVNGMVFGLTWKGNMGVGV